MRYSESLPKYPRSRTVPGKAFADFGLSRVMNIFSGRMATHTASPVFNAAELAAAMLPPSFGTAMIRPLLPGFGDFAIEHVDRADEARHELAGGILVDFGRRADLADHALVHHGNAVGQGHGLFLVMGHDHEGDAGFLLDVHDFELRVLAQFLVESAQRLVEQQELRLFGQGPRQRHALALAAGKLVRLAPGKFRELHQIEHLLSPDRGARHRSSARVSGHSRRFFPPSYAETARRTGTSC